MALIKCKMCGGDLRLEEGSTVCECEYCGTKQTVPKLDDEKKVKLFERANRLRAQCEFDKAAGVYETIVADFPEEAEAYWGLVLCKYGIEYVDDPATGKKIPTCHRSSFDNVLKDANFEQACEYTDAVARRVYRDEARAIEELRRGILEVSGKEEPYDVFISYKEKDENGERTPDSVIAQDIYRELTREGYRVFFSRISLENRLGTEYEPYIFAALNSAKVMIVVGTDYENFDAVWVKNEWSRFLKLIAAGQKKTLIPVFKNMDAYDMPEEFNKLTALDMGKLGAMQDLVRGVEKIISKKTAEPTSAQQPVFVSNEADAKTAAAVKRGFLALEGGEWDKAKEYFDQALALDAECAEAYLGLALANEQCKDEQQYIDRACERKGSSETLLLPAESKRVDEIVKANTIKNYLDESTLREMLLFDLTFPSAVKGQTQVAQQEKERFKNNRSLSLAFRFAKGETAEKLRAFQSRLFEGLDQQVEKAKAQEEQERKAKAVAYGEYLTSEEQEAVKLHSEAEEKQEAAYQSACETQRKADSARQYYEATSIFNTLIGYRDSEERVKQCNTSAAELERQEQQRKEAKAKAEAEEAERQRIAREKAEKAAKAKKNRLTIAAILAAVLVAAGYFIYTKVDIPGRQYSAAEALFAAGQYEQAVAAFTALGDYKDSAARTYAAAEALLEAGRYEEALAAFITLGDYKDSPTRAKYAEAETLLMSGDTAHAAMAFGSIGNYKDVRTRSLALWERVTQRDTVTAGGSHTVGLRSDGTVVATKYTGKDDYGQCDVGGWTDIVAVATGGSHTVGLRSDGTVVATKYTGKDDYGRCEVSGWTDIVAIAAGNHHTVGLRADGTVVAVGDNYDGRCEVSGWTDIVAVAAGSWHTVGLRADGTVVAVGDNGDGQCDVSDWTDVVAVAAGGLHTVGLRSDGTVVAVGNNSSGQCEVSDWTDVVAVAAGYNYTVGLRSDGTVVATGWNKHGQCEVSGWTDMVAVAAGFSHTVGLRSDGTVVAVGENDDGQCNVSGWKNIKLPNT